MDIWVTSPSWLLWIVLLWTWVGKYLLETLIPILLCSRPEMGLLGHMVVLLWTFWGTSILFSVVFAAFYNPTNHAQGFQFRYILTNTYSLLFFFFKIVAIWMGIRWYFIVVLAHISLMTNDVEHLFIGLLAICILALEKCLSKSCDQY